MRGSDPVCVLLGIIYSKRRRTRNDRAELSKLSSFCTFIFLTGIQNVNGCVQRERAYLPIDNLLTYDRELNRCGWMRCLNVTVWLWDEWEELKRRADRWGARRGIWKVNHYILLNFIISLGRWSIGRCCSCCQEWIIVVEDRNRITRKYNNYN